MLKCLLVIVLLMPLGAIAHASDKNQSTNLAKHDSKNNVPPSVPVISNQTCPPNTSSTDQDSPYWYASPEWWLFILGVPTLIFVAVQSWLMKRHAEHLGDLAGAAKANSEAAKSAADAALLQAQHMEKTLVLQFRPKLIVRGGIIVDKEVTLWVTNIGGTPAHIVRAMISIMLTSANYEDVLKGTNETMVTGATFAGGESILVTIPITEEIDKVLNPVPAQSPDGSPRSKPVLLGGFVRYRDDLGIIRNTGLWRRSKGNLFVVDPDSDWDYAD